MEGWTLRSGHFVGAEPSRCEVVTASFDRTPTRRRTERLKRGGGKKKSPDFPRAVFANATLPVAPQSSAVPEGVCTCPPAPVCRARRRAVAGGGSINDSVVLIASEAFFYIYVYFYHFPQTCQRLGKNQSNVNSMKVRVRRGCLRRFPSAHALQLKLRQAASAKLARSLYYV